LLLFSNFSCDIFTAPAGGIVAPEDAITGDLHSKFMAELKARISEVLEETTPLAL
jgi:hypothetical protein